MLSLAMLARLGATTFSVALTRALPPGALTPIEYQIQSGYHFLTYYITATYPTVLNVGSAPPVLTDDGVNRLSVRFADKNHQLAMTGETPIDLATIAAPGRQRYPGVSGDPSNALHIPGFLHQHVYAAKGGIIANVFNGSNRAYEAGAVNLTYSGIVIPVAKAATENDVWRILLSSNPALAAQLQ